MYIDNLLEVSFRSSLERCSWNYDPAFSMFFLPHSILSSKRLYTWLSFLGKSGVAGSCVASTLIKKGAENGYF